VCEACAGASAVVLASVTELCRRLKSSLLQYVQRLAMLGVDEGLGLRVAIWTRLAPDSCSWQPAHAGSLIICTRPGQEF
jgi:hypothetical protein